MSTYIKTTFAFDSSVIMSPLAMPKEILNEIIDDIISYIEPKVTRKTQIYIEALQDLKTKDTFDITYSDYKNGLRRGKSNMYSIGKFRRDGIDSLTFEDIISKNENLLNWWKKI